MKRLIPLLVLPWLVSCGGPKSEPIPENLPAFCIRGVEVHDDYVMIDLPGYPHGMNDKPIKVSKEFYQDFKAPECAPNDPRMTNND